MPFAVTDFPTPALADANVAVPVQPTTSPPIAPLTAQAVSVALVVPSYTLFAAVTAAVTVAAVMVALAVPVFPPPTLADANVAVPVQPTTSPLMAPLRVQPASVALVVPSYTLLEAVMSGVTDFWVTVSPLVPLEEP